MPTEWTSPNQTEVRTSKLVQLSDCNLENKVLLGGQLLKWMDIIACLAGRFYLRSWCKGLHHPNPNLSRVIGPVQQVNFCLKCILSRCDMSELTYLVGVQVGKLVPTRNDARTSPIVWPIVMLISLLFSQSAHTDMSAETCMFSNLGWSWQCDKETKTSKIFWKHFWDCDH